MKTFAPVVSLGLLVAAVSANSTPSFSAGSSVAAANGRLQQQQKHDLRQQPKGALQRSRSSAWLVRGGEMKSPPDLYATAVALGEKKATLPSSKVALLSMMSGLHIGIGALLAITVGGNMAGMATTNPGLQKIIFGLFGLPLGLMMVLVCGGELFTGNTALIAAAYYEKRASLKGMLRNWVVSYLGNFVGCVALAKFVTMVSMVAVPSAAAAMASTKTSFPFMVLFGRGMLCNWLVCTAVWLASGASTLTEKYLAMVIPISAFVAMGAEHSVANMFLIPLGLFNGATVTWADVLLKNILPVTLGNIVGGAVVQSGTYAAIYGSLLK